MANIFGDEMMELEELFADDKSNMRNQHIEFAKRDYGKLKQLGYVRTPSELKLNQYFWVDISFYMNPRIQVIEIEKDMEIRMLTHPNGLWTYGVSVWHGNRGWSFLPGIFTGLYRTENDARNTAINSLIKFIQADKKTEKLVEKLKKRLSGNLQLDLFAALGF